MDRNRKSMIALFALLAVGVGTATVEGLPTCKRIIKTIKEKRVPNKVSKTTLAKWALWGESHPDFKPHRRPKYKITRQEVAEKVAFACEVPLQPAPQRDDPTPDFPVLEFPPVAVDFPPPALPDVVEVATNDTPPLPFIPPYSPGIPPETPSPVPEDSTWILLFTGVGFLLLVRARHASSTAANVS